MGCRYGVFWSNSPISTRVVAPITGPQKEDIPPTTTQMKTNTEAGMVKDPGLIIPEWEAKNPPAIPAKKAPILSEKTLYEVTFIPMLRAKVSPGIPKMDFKILPIREFSILYKITNVIPTKTQIK
jgi:hypothetical protein